METVGFDNAFIFKYSPRPGTVAAARVDDVPQADKERRLAILLEDLERRVTALNQAYLGSELEVMVEGPSKLNAARLSGRTRCNKVVLFAPPAGGWTAGDLVTVRIERATAHSLYGVTG